ncbi:hypothetical protein ACBJ59_19265 [Nonomuraea sp. MTCD27]|uniref:hypothetical protein n=1 Tax=Nonomuraea sp. MTCD27 TaxID=1676747 RepID=UPI0035BF7E47
MPVPVVVAATLQFLLAATFLAVPLAVHTHGDRVQRAAEGVLARHGVPAEALAKHRIKFAESVLELMFPVSIAVVLLALGGLVLGGVSAGRILSWGAAGLLLTGGGLVTGSQVFARRVVVAVLRRSADPAVRGLDGGAVADAAARAFPAWLRPVILIRFALTTLGSLLVIVLLATPAAGVYFGG